jgi:hypothetical protein
MLLYLGLSVALSAWLHPVAVALLSPGRGVAYLWLFAAVAVALAAERAAQRRRALFATTAALLAAQWPQESVALQALALALLCAEPYLDPLGERAADRRALVAALAGAGLSLAAALVTWAVLGERALRRLLSEPLLWAGAAVLFALALSAEWSSRDDLAALRRRLHPLGLGALAVVAQLLWIPLLGGGWGAVPDTAELGRLAFLREVPTAVPPEAAVLVPPHWDDFRMRTGRSPLAVAKDRGSALADRDFAFEWKGRMAALEGLYGPGGEAHFRKGLSGSDLRALAGRYPGAHLAFAVGTSEVDLPLALQVGPYRLYALGPGEP